MKDRRIAVLRCAVALTVAVLVGGAAGYGVAVAFRPAASEFRAPPELRRLADWTDRELRRQSNYRSRAEAAVQTAQRERADRESKAFLKVVSEWQPALLSGNVTLRRKAAQQIEAFVHALRLEADLGPAPDGVLDGVTDKDLEVRVACIRILGRTRSIREYWKRVVQILLDPQEDIPARRAAAEALAEVADEPSVRVALESSLDCDSAVLRVSAAAALAKRIHGRDERVESILLGAMGDEILCEIAMGALLQLKPREESVVSTIAGLCDSRVPAVRAAAAIVAAELGKRSHGVMTELAAAVMDPSLRRSIRLAAVDTLARCGPGHLGTVTRSLILHER